MAKLHHTRSGLVLLSTALFVLVIPSLPARRYHLAFWAIGFLVEVALIYAIWPFERH